MTDPGRERRLPLNPTPIVALAVGAVGLALALRSGLGSSSRSAGLAGLVFLIVGSALASTTLGDAYQRSLPNPVPVTAASLVRGEALYQEHCIACHGATGRGDGPAAVALRPRPADFRVHMAAGHTDQELSNWVSTGIQGTAMPGFGDLLPEQDRWHVINFIRGFASPQPSAPPRAEAGGPFAMVALPYPGFAERGPAGASPLSHGRGEDEWLLVGLLGAALAALVFFGRNKNDKP